ncbi:MAG: tryptophan synthase subunit alpha [Opitutales bacterium]
MNKLMKVLEKKEKLLSVYFTVGFPKLNDTQEIIKELDSRNVDILEVGLPFSDPIADGLTIQHSSSVALKNGMNIDLMFEQVGKVSNEVNCALVLMAYLNPIFKYGIEKTFIKCKEAGIAAMIIPDLPLAEYISEWKPLEEKYDVRLAMLITPQSGDARIKQIDEATDAFVYVVSMASVTGVKDDFSQDQVEYFKRVGEMKLKNKTLIGFGISNNKTLSKAKSYSDGAIIGSAYIKCLDEAPTIKDATENFFGRLLEINSD